jgi:hypothetical protein
MSDAVVRPANEPGPAGAGYIQITAADGNPVHPTIGSSFNLEDEDMLLVCMTQEQYNEFTRKVDPQ